MRDARLHFVAIVALIAPLLAPGAARADYPSPAPYIGAHVGPDVLLAPWDFGDAVYVNELSPRENLYAMGGLRFGWQFGPRLAVEAGLSLHPFESKLGEPNLALKSDVDVLYHLSDADITLFPLVGVGGFHSLSGDLGSDFDPHVHAGIGLRVLATERFALRFEAREVLTDGFDGVPGNHFEVRGGFDLFLAGRRDQDKDGIVDDEDTCPDVFGVASASGCPDADGDGLADSVDTCPSEPGGADLAGCPDRDGDKIADKDDACPADVGPKELGGCPDGDGDGVIDKNDTCPTVKGLAALAGCPDTDGDGLTDSADACPTAAGTRATKGCPDRDRDGVADADDQCPDVTGLRQHKGCIPEAVKKFTGAIKGINFETGSAKILPTSFATLDKAVAVLVEFQDLKLQIEGHTDDVGDDASNLKLSQDRAASVRDYFVSKGVDTARLIPKGFGETKPAADNKTKAGKAQNRRIEFTLLGAD